MTEDQVSDLVLDYDLDAPPEKVWRAISIPGFRETWLPGKDLAEADPVTSAPDREIRYRMRDRDAPFLESLVTLQLAPNEEGGTRLRIIQVLADARAIRELPPTANGNTQLVSRAA